MFCLKYFTISIFILFVVLSSKDNSPIVLAKPTHLSQPGLQMLLINGQEHEGHKAFLPHRIVKRLSCSGENCFTNCLNEEKNAKDKEAAKPDCASMCDCTLPKKN
ncbi:hypothetical protein Mgra_00009350 [Meloidogyne graminicola]|uniref:Uncharacterized protein n=1 Tax=Meloidogyne graminicola TaxID=189291 RepID=A0A8S9Z812_9BILA|nr:hypothetical protein Mgra_00009350 [Meloidogyne graminicola]